MNTPASRRQVASLEHTNRCTDWRRSVRSNFLSSVTTTRAQQGESSSQSDFHEAVLSAGPVPVSVLHPSCFSKSAGSSLRWSPPKAEGSTPIARHQGTGHQPTEAGATQGEAKRWLRAHGSKATVAPFLAWRGSPNPRRPQP